MSIVFNQAPIISSGSVPLATHMKGLADAINSRILSGLGDCTKRIHQYTFNLNRQIRNPDAENNFPSLGEFSMYYQHLNYDNTPATWPEAPAGDFEGANLAAPSNQFVFGIGDPDDGGTYGEGDGLSEYDFFTPTGTTAEAYWNLSKYQRGGYDPNTEAQFTPMLDLAQRHFRLTFPNWSRHHKSPGGYLPTPEKSWQDCYAIDPDTLATINYSSYIYKFKNINTDIIEYTGTGTCGSGYGGSDTDVLGVSDYGFAYYVYQYDGTVYRFDKSDYIMVNDGGGFPAREDGGQINRLMLNPFIMDFRGTDSQRTQTCFDETPYIPYAFGNQEFYTSQYQLAPNYGVEIDNTIVTDYPFYSWTTDQASGSVSSATVVQPNFRIGGHLVRQSKLVNNVEMQLLENDVVIHTFTINKTSGSYVETFLNGPTGTVKYKFASDATFTDPTGYIEIEQSQLLQYKPEIWDGYAVIRMSSALGAIGNEMDQRGIDTDYSRTLYDNYRQYGCFFNVNGGVGVEQQSTAVNVNPVFDSMRKYVNSFVKTINGTDMRTGTRPMLVGYEVSESYSGPFTSSKSILYFNRYQAGLGLVTNNLDCFEGLCNATDATQNGIVTTAEPRGYTNEWVMELCGKPYKDVEGSIYKPEVYSNYFPYINRCHILPGYQECDNTFNSNLFRFLQENSPTTAADLRSEMYFPESLTAYNYDGQAPRFLNKKLYDEQDDANGVIAKNFYKSCQIYPKPYVIEKVEETTGNIVKVTLDRRLQYCSGSAPEGVIANNVASWNFNTIAAEPYRSDENIVRLFLIKMYDDTKNPSQAVGDVSVNSELPFSSENPYASIYPTFFFTKLIPKPYANNGYQSSDTGSLDTSGSLPRAYDIQLCETYIRSMCEGFVDETLSTNSACNTDFSTDYDYTYTNLCNDAFGGNWINNITGSIRDDNPLTYGPLPGMVMYSQIYNQVAACVNKLTKVRLPLPYRLLARRKLYTGSVTVSPDWPLGGSDCSTNVSKGVFYAFTPATADQLVSTSDWFDSDGGFGVSTQVYASCNGPTWVFTTEKTTAELAFDTTDPLAWNAVNDDLRALASGSNIPAAVFARDSNSTNTIDMDLTGTPNGCSDDENFWFDDVSSQWWNNVGAEVTETECTYHEGDVELTADDVPPGDIAAGWKFNPITGDTICHYLPSTNKQIEVRNLRHMIINVPTI